MYNNIFIFDSFLRTVIYFYDTYDRYYRSCRHLPYTRECGPLTLTPSPQPFPHTDTNTTTKIFIATQCRLLGATCCWRKSESQPSFNCKQISLYFHCFLSFFLSHFVGYFSLTVSIFCSFFSLYLSHSSPYNFLMHILFVITLKDVNTKILQHIEFTYKKTKG